MRDYAKIIRERESKTWDKRVGQKRTDLFWGNEEKTIIVTRDGFRTPFTIEELIEIERNSGDLEDILANVED